MKGLGSVVKEQSRQHIHSHPSDCLVNLGFEFDDGGSRKYWRDILHKDRHKAGAGDCSVIAASIALEQGMTTRSLTCTL